MCAREDFELVRVENVKIFFWPKKFQLVGDRGRDLVFITSPVSVDFFRLFESNVYAVNKNNTSNNKIKIWSNALGPTF